MLAFRSSFREAVIPPLRHALLGLIVCATLCAPAAARQCVIVGDASGDFAAARLTATGQRDLTFGSAGTTRFNIFGTDAACASVRLANGRILLAGVAGGDFAVARLNSTGTIDATFGTGGAVRFNISGTDVASAIAVQADGKILVAGESSGDFAVARLLSTGALDATFGAAGKVRFNIAGTDRAFAMLLQLDGKIVVAGDSSGDFAVARLNTNGSLDSTFGVGGKVRFNISGTDIGAAIVRRSDGKLLVVGESSGDFAAAQLNTNGSLDSTYGFGGAVRFNISGTDRAFATLLQPDGKLVLAGDSSGDFAAARLNANGSLDSTFGVGGTVRFNISGTDLAAGMLRQADGKLILAGSSSGDFAAARLNTNGSLDSTFGSGGTIRFNLFGTDVGYAITP